MNCLFDPRLKPASVKVKPFISVLIPARNEEKNITNILNDLCNQDYTNIEIIVFNDDSTDNTGAIVENFTVKKKNIKIINSKTLPAGWLGKNFGCYNLSKHAKGDYFLYLDADVRIKNTFIESAVAHLQKYRLGLLSIFPKQEMYGIGEKISVPVMNTILLSLLPLILVRKSNKPSLAAANGQFMLFESEIYRKLNPHKNLRKSKVEDIAIARNYKRSGVKIDCLTGNATISCRMYSKYGDAISGFTKNLTSFFGNSVFLSILYWLITTFGIFIVFFFLPGKMVILYLLCSIFCRILISIISNQDIIHNLIYLIPQQVAMGHIILRTVTNNYQKRNKWKDRPID